MAKVIQSQQQIFVEPWWAKAKVIVIGIGLGVAWWVVTTLLRVYIVEPIACKDTTAVAACAGSMTTSGAIATVLIAILGVVLLIRYLQPRPIIIAVATAALLWDLGTVVGGLVWWVVLLWAIFFYMTSYSLFSMVARIPWLGVSLALAVIIVVSIRLLLIM